MQQYFLEGVMKLRRKVVSTIGGVILVSGILVAVSAPTASAGPNTMVGVCMSHPSFPSVGLGCAHFEDLGELLHASDINPDNRRVTAWARVGSKRYSTYDTNGAAGGWSTRNLSFAEGTSVYIKVCVTGFGCSSEKRAVA
jgi:hypothetical protein